jgi:hypothetical protein
VQALARRQRPALVPRLVSEETLDAPRESVALPEVRPLPAGERLHVASVDVNELPPLPILASPVLDRASLDDATVEASTAAALSAPLPPRAGPAPFVRLAIPDPYENRRPLTGALPGETTEPVTATPQTPKR